MKFDAELRSGPFKAAYFSHSITEPPHRLVFIAVAHSEVEDDERPDGHTVVRWEGRGRRDSSFIRGAGIME